MDLRRPFDTFKDEFLDDAAFLILRLGLGFGMLFGHGLRKWGKLFGSGDEPIGMLGHEGTVGLILFSLVVFSEVICSIFLMLGLFTRWAAFFLLFTMIVAVFYVHLGDPFGSSEKGFLYLVGYVAIFLAGAGNFSVDARLGRSH